jgi:hypothetical protein
LTDPFPSGSSGSSTTSGSYDLIVQQLVPGYTSLAR